MLTGLRGFRHDRRSRSSLWLWLRFLWIYKTTPAGRFFLVGTGFAESVAITSLDIATYHLFDMLAALCVMAWLVGILLRPRARVSGDFPAKASAGEPLTVSARVQNVSRLHAYDVSMGFFDLPDGIRPEGNPDLRPVLPGGESAVLRARLLPLRRGLYELPPLRVFSTFPFRIFRSGSVKQPVGSLLVLPRFHPLTSVDLPVGSRYQPGGVALTSNVGESPEYIGNRDYRPGDSTRRIDFRSWARLARPVVREFQEEYYCLIALVLDTFVPRARKKAPVEGFPQLEAAVSLAAALADAMSRGEYLIDIFAAGPELYVFRAGRHTAHFENILEILACVDACPTNPFDTVAPALVDELGNISTVVCVLLDWDEARQGLVRVAREAGCSVKVVVVRDEATTLPLDEADVQQCGIAAVREGGVDEL